MRSPVKYTPFDFLGFSSDAISKNKITIGKYKIMARRNTDLYKIIHSNTIRKLALNDKYDDNTTGPTYIILFTDDYVIYVRRWDQKEIYRKDVYEDA